MKFLAVIIIHFTNKINNEEVICFFGRINTLMKVEIESWKQIFGSCHQDEFV